MNLVRTVQSNLPQINTAALGIASVLGYIITILTAVADVSLSVATVIIDNWSWIGPLVMGAALALGVYWAPRKAWQSLRGLQPEQQQPIMLWSISYPLALAF